jgi:hypothetical protein
MTASILRALAAGFAAGLIGILPVAAGEGSADIGRQPPYGYYAGESGHASPGATRPATTRGGRTTRQPRSR